jgi:hypothetical protein
MAGCFTPTSRHRAERQACAAYRLPPSIPYLFEAQSSHEADPHQPSPPLRFHHVRRAAINTQMPFPHRCVRRRGVVSASCVRRTSTGRSSRRRACAAGRHPGHRTCSLGRSVRRARRSTSGPDQRSPIFARLRTTRSRARLRRRSDGKWCRRPSPSPTRGRRD